MLRLFIDNVKPIFWVSVTMCQGVVLPTEELGIFSTLAFLPHMLPNPGTSTLAKMELQLKPGIMMMCTIFLFLISCCHFATSCMA
jgi:hypothetical protein